MKEVKFIDASVRDLVNPDSSISLAIKKLYAEGWILELIQALPGYDQKILIVFERTVKR